MDVTTTSLVATILFILAIFLKNIAFAPRNYWTSREIPSFPGALPIVGNALSLFLLKDSITSLCKKIYDSYPDSSMVGFYRLNTPILLIRDPELAKTVLQTSFKNFPYNELQLNIETDPLYGRDPLFSRGKDWKDSRINFTHALSPKRLKIMSLVVAKVCKKLEKHLNEKLLNNDYFEFEGKQLFSRFSMEVSAGCVFGIDGNSFADDYRGTLLECMKTVTKPSVRRGLKHMIRFYLPALNKMMKNSFVPTEVDKYVREIVNDLEAVRKKDGVPRNDVLQLVLDREKNGEITKIEAIGHAFSFMLENFETTSLTVSTMSYYIAKDPRVQERMRAEIKTVMTKYGGQLTYEAINELNYVEQVMFEAMRMVPATGVVTRVCARAHHLKGSDGLAVDVKPGDAVIISSLGLHMDPKIWKNPEKFNPERFKKGHDEGRHEFVHLPFSAGPKSCPGQRLAIMQAKAVMATILKNYHIESSPKMQEPLRMDPRYFLLTPIGGYWCRLRHLRNN